MVPSVFFLTIFEALVYDQNNQFVTGMIRSLPEIKKSLKISKSNHLQTGPYQTLSQICAGVHQEFA
jgi:hypothetical protein